MGAQYVESLKASREIYAPHGMVNVESLESVGVFKDGTKRDVASTYDMKFVTHAVKDLKLP